MQTTEQQILQARRFYMHGHRKIVKVQGRDKVVNEMMFYKLKQKYTYHCFYISLRVLTDPVLNGQSCVKTAFGYI